MGKKVDKNRFEDKRKKKKFKITKNLNSKVTA